MASEHKQYFVNKYMKHGLITKGYHDIAWKYIGRSREKLNIKQNATITKLQNNWLNVGHQKKYTKKVPKCPVCGIKEETQLHMYQCTHPEARKVRLHAFQQMKEYLLQNGIPSQIGNTFTNVCEAVCNKNL